MDLEKISIKTVLEDYIEFAGEELQLEESVILKVADDTMAKIATGESLDFRIAVLDVKQYQAPLPKGFRTVVQCAYRDLTEGKARREQIVEWQQRVWGSDCKLKIELECPDCHQESCNCSSDVVTVNADDMWRDSHPELIANKWKHFYDYGSLGDPMGVPCSGFKLMKRTSNSFFATKYHIPGCVNFSFDSKHEYDISPPKMILNFKDGEVMLAYMSIAYDSDGYRMIVNHPRVHEALFYAIIERTKFRDWLKTGDPKFQSMFREAERKKNESITMARSAISIPDPDKWFQFLKNHLTKFTPNWRWEENLNRETQDEYRYPKF